MIMNKLKEHFYLILIILLALLVLPITYYFTFTLPQYHKEQLELERQKQEADFSQNEKVTQQAEIQAAQKGEGLTKCTEEASATYNLNWSSSCKKIADETSNRISEAQKAYDTCHKERESGDMTGAPFGGYCYPEYYELSEAKDLGDHAVYKADCQLPSSTATRWDELLKENKDNCYKLYGN